MPTDMLNKLDHFGAGLNIRNSYNLWSEDSETKKLFKKFGVEHPDDMSGIIMEMFLRAQKNIPFELHRLIELQAGCYKAEDKVKCLKRMEKEFLIYQQ